MATAVIKRYWVDLDDMRMTAALGEASPITELRLKARDSGRIGFQFHRSGTPELLASGSVLTFGIKLRNDWGGSYLASVTSFTAATTTNSSGFADTDFYHGALNLNTTAIDDALGTSEASIQAMSELEIDVSGSGLRFSTDTIDTLIYNDVNQGGEGVPGNATPPYPQASEVMRWKPDITSLTGGTASDLDSLATTTLVDLPYAVSINNQDTTDIWEVWILDAGTDAEDAPNGIVRPDDYAGGTNEKVWKRKAYYGPLTDGSVLTSGLTFPQNGLDLTDPDGQILTLNAGNITANSTLSIVSGNYTLTIGANATITGNASGTVSGTANEITVTSNVISIPSTLDLSGKSVLKIPTSAAPTVSANGTLALDTTVTNFSHGILKYYGNETLAVVALPESQISSPTNGHVVKYNSTNDEFELGAATSSFYDQLFIPVEAMYLETTAPAGALATVATSGNSIDYRYYPFDASTAEYVCGTFQIPDDWDGSAITVEIDWLPDSGAMTNPDAVKWTLEYRSIAEGELINQGTTGTKSTTYNTTTAQYKTVHSPFILDDANQPITAQDHIFGRVFRDTSVANDFAGTVVTTEFEVLYTSKGFPTSN